jgi:hypothetical protein
LRELEDGGGDAVAVEHEVFADVAGGVGEAVGMLFTGREKKKARRFCAVGAHDNGFGTLEMRGFLFVEVQSAGGAAGGV